MTATRTAVFAVKQPTRYGFKFDNIIANKVRLCYHIFMVILISGTTHTGKTALSQRLMVKYKMPYFSIDHLKMGLIRSGKTSLTIKDDKELTPYLWPIIKEIIKTAIENR